MTKANEKIYFLLSFIGVIGLAVGIIFSKYLAISLIFFSNIFFTAYSDAKILVFLLYLAVMFLATCFVKHQIQIKRRDKIFLNISIFILAALSLFSYIYVSRSFDLPFNKTSSFIYNGGFDTTVGPFHIHTFKPVLTWILTIFGIRDLPYYGSGLTFFQAFKELRLFYIMSSFLLLLTVFQLMRFGIYLGQKHGVFFLWVYGIFSYGIMKAIIDGGPLWYEAYLNYVLLWLLVYFFNQKKILPKKKIVNLLVMGIISIYVVLVLLQAGVNSIFSIQMLKTRPIVEYALFFTGLGLILLIRNKKKYILFTIICFILGIYFHLYSPVVSYIKYGSLKVNPQNKVTILSQNKLNLPLVTSENNLYLYRYDVKKEESIFSILAKYSHLFYHEVSVDGITCDSKKISSKSTLISVVQGKFYFWKSYNDPFLSQITLETMSPSKNIYKVDYKYNDCLFDSRAVLISHLQRLGFYSFILHQ
ncbi:MAG: hypothetical protein WC741_02945 [Patescibacteria group bacterium]|jgi:hypothetical protein